MEDLLIQTLEPFGYPVRRQGSFGAEEQYPDHFFTFWNNTTYDDSFYDNADFKTVWDFDLNFYSVDPELPYEMLKRAKEALKEKSFIVSGQGYDVASDEPTHMGRGMNISKIETEGECYGNKI